MSIEVMKQARAASFEFSDKGAAEVVVCKTGLTYGVQCVNFPNVFAQFVFESDAKQFVNIFNGTVAQRVESPVTGGGGGFESHPVSANAPAVDAEPVAWMYDFVVDNEVIKNWTTIDHKVAYSTVDGCHNQRPLYLHPPLPITNPDLTIDKVCPQCGSTDTRTVHEYAGGEIVCAADECNDCGHQWNVG